MWNIQLFHQFNVSPNGHIMEMKPTKIPCLVKFIRRNIIGKMGNMPGFAGKWFEPSKFWIGRCS